MSKKCARPECGKTVYPLEELKCLDKVWHKGCFKCAVCGMTLSMKNYKGYDKVPYCEAHYPKTVASVVSDTPEMRRLAENTKNQSLVQYHADFEKQKGRKIEVCDDPEMERVKKNMQIVSNAVYHNEVEKKEQMERIRPPHEVQRSWFGLGRRRRTDNYFKSVGQSGQSSTMLFDDPQQQPAPHHHHPPAGAQATAFSQAANINGVSPYSAKQQHTSTLVYSSEQGGQEPNEKKRVAPQPQRQVGSLDDYDPLNGEWGSISTSGGAKQLNGAPKQAAPAAPPQQPPPQQPSPTSPVMPVSSNPRNMGGMPPQQNRQPVGAMTALGGPQAARQQQQQQHSPQYPSSLKQQPAQTAPAQHSPQPVPVQQPVQQPPPQQQQQQQQQQQLRQQQQLPQQPVPAMPQQQQQPQPPRTAPPQIVYRAMYDYTAADTDEVTFVEGDLIINTAPVDEGWMTGTVKRTNQWGMLPANYVERVA